MRPGAPAAPHSRALFALRCVLLAVSSVALPSTVLSQTDEIQVYDGTHVDPGTIGLTLHNNFTPDGLKAPAFPGGIVSDDSLNGVPEWAYGITDWMEAGLYLPLYSIARRNTRRDAMIDGVKVRVLFAVPRAAQRRFFYGLNFEFSDNASHWDPTRFTSELRPIVGWRLGRLDLIFNPILDTAYTRLRDIEFDPAARLAWNVSDKSAVALEEYAGFGPVHRFHRARLQSHKVFAVFDRGLGRVSLEAGIGYGLTHASDRLTLKVMLAADLRRSPTRRGDR